MPTQTFSWLAISFEKIQRELAQAAQEKVEREKAQARAERLAAKIRELGLEPPE
jgi:hypothetical protein